MIRPHLSLNGIVFCTQELPQSVASMLKSKTESKNTIHSLQSESQTIFIDLLFVP